MNAYDDAGNCIGSHVLVGVLLRWANGDWK